MEEKLDFSVPGEKPKKSTGRIVIVLLLILLVLNAVNLIIGLRRQGHQRTEPAKSPGLSAEQTKELASRLARRNLYQPAAKLWQDYLLTNELPDKERAKQLFQIGTLLEKAGHWAEAIQYYYHSEITAKLAELEPQINAHIKDCFEKLGRFSALRYELMDRTSLESSPPAGGKILAEIGAEKITEADLDAIIESSIDSQLSPMAAFMTQQQLNEQKKRMLEQYKSGEAKMQFLQSWLAQEVLYRQALQDKLTETDEVKKLVDELTRSVLSQHLMNRQLADRIHITETDLQTYYQANKDKFVEPADKEDPNSSERQKSFDEVRQQVEMDILSQKRQDVQAEFIKQMMDEYNVIIHTSALMPANPSEK